MKETPRKTRLRNKIDRNVALEVAVFDLNEWKELLRQRYRTGQITMTLNKVARGSAKKMSDDYDYQECTKISAVRSSDTVNIENKVTLQAGNSRTMM